MSERLFFLRSPPECVVARQPPCEDTSEEEEYEKVRGTQDRERLIMKDSETFPFFFGFLCPLFPLYFFLASPFRSRGFFVS